MLVMEGVINRQALIRLNAMQSWRRLPTPQDGRPYGPGWFRTRDWVKGLESENRRVSMRLSRMGTCIFCGAQLPAGSTGDHIVPLSKGGPQGAQNYLPLCRNDNSSKGDRDLLEWWQSKGRSVAELPDDVICAYARLMWQLYKPQRLLDDRASDYLRTAVESMVAALALSPEHQQAVNALS